MKRLMYLSHHWLGIGICLLMAMWFFSGMVMMYVQYPALTAEERLTGLPFLDAESIQVSPQTIAQKNPAIAAISQIKLSSITERPAYIIQNQNRLTHIFFADTGEAAKEIELDTLLKTADLYAQRHGLSQSQHASFEKTLDTDQWTVAGYVNNQRPFHLIRLNDSAGTKLYFSAKTGELIRDTNFKERSWNWLGANIHWLYPTVIRQYPKFWYWLIVVLSITGLLSIFTGAIVGWWRLRLKKRYKHRRITPYSGQMKLHHIMGLLFLVPITTYTYSGLMSMGSFGVANDKVPYFQQLQQYQGEKTLNNEAFNLDAVKQQVAQAKNAKELIWHWLDGQVHGYSLNSQNQKSAFDQRTLAQRQENALALLKPIMQGHTATAQVLERYDRYYYAHHQRQPTLPVLRICFDDSDKSWFYVDLRTGELLYRQTKNGRAMRWLYKGLHSLDFPILINHRPLWDVICLLLNSLGFIFSMSAVVIAWRYLKCPRKRQIKLFKKCRKTLENKV